MQSNSRNLSIYNHNLIDIAKGNVSGIQNFHKFGYNPAITTAPEVIWGVGGQKTWLQTAQNVQITSNNAQDDISGLGANQVLLSGLDANWDIQEEIVNLVGNGIAYSTKQFIRLPRAYVYHTGSFHTSNYDELNIATSGGGTDLGVINGGIGYTTGTPNYGAGQTENAFYSVPRGKTAYITRIATSVDVGSNKTASLRMFWCQNANTTNSPKRVIWRLEGFNSQYNDRTDGYFKIPEYSDIWFEATATTNSKISVDFDFFLVNN
jgi:hypothetical protein